MISKNISKQILTVGEGYHRPRGGISSVLNTYSKHFSDYKFVSTYNPNLGKWRNIFHFMEGIMSLCKVLFFDKDINIIHIHGCHNGSFYRKLIVLYIGKMVFRKKVIYHSHSSEFHEFYEKSNNLTKKMIHFFVEKTDVVICLSRQWRDFFKENFNPGHIVILENIVERVAEVGKTTSNSELQVLFLGEIGERKGIFDMVEMLVENRSYFEGKMHLIIGGNGDIKKLVKFINNNNLQSLVTYQGWVSGTMKHDLLLNSDLFILPSYNEGLPVSILEAMSYDLAVISTDVGGISEVVKDGRNGYLLTPGNKNAMFSSLKEFVDNPPLTRIMGDNAKALIAPYYSDSVIPKLESIYTVLLKQ